MLSSLFHTLHLTCVVYSRIQQKVALIPLINYETAQLCWLLFAQTKFSLNNDLDWQLFNDVRFRVSSVVCKVRIFGDVFFLYVLFLLVCLRARVCGLVLSAWPSIDT